MGGLGVAEALRNVLPLAVAVAVFPVPVVAVVLLLGSDRGLGKAIAFDVCWLAGLLAVGGVVLLVAGGAGASDDGEPAAWVAALLVVLGVVVLALAAKQWRGRPRAGEEATMPGWMRAIDGLTVARSGGTGFALAAFNPKNALLAVAAGAEIAEVGLPAGRQAVVLVVFALVASAGVLVPLLLAVLLGPRAHPLLDGIRSWMTRHSATIMAVLFLLIGLKLVADGVAGLT